MQRPDGNDEEATDKQVTQEPLITPEIPRVKDRGLSTEEQRWVLYTSPGILPVASIEPCNKEVIYVNSNAHSNHVCPEAEAVSCGRADGDGKGDDR